jgi:hypothetical protein
MATRHRCTPELTAIPRDISPEIGQARPFVRSRRPYGEAFGREIPEARGQLRPAPLSPIRSHDLYKSIVALLVGKPPLTRDSSPVEVKGFEPSASALRMSRSRPFDQGVF